MLLHQTYEFGRFPHSEFIVKHQTTSRELIKNQHDCIVFAFLVNFMEKRGKQFFYKILFFVVILLYVQCCVTLPYLNLSVIHCSLTIEVIKAAKWFKLKITSIGISTSLFQFFRLKFGLRSIQHTIKVMFSHACSYDSGAITDSEKNLSVKI